MVKYLLYIITYNWFQIKSQNNGGAIFKKYFYINTSPKSTFLTYFLGGGSVLSPIFSANFSLINQVLEYRELGEVEID